MEFEHLLDSFDLLYSLWWACCRNSICRTSCTTSRKNPTSAQTPLVRFVVDLLRIFLCGFVVQQAADLLYSMLYNKSTKKSEQVLGPNVQNILRFIVYRMFIVRSTYDNDLKVLKFLSGMPQANFRTLSQTILQLLCKWIFPKKSLAPFVGCFVNLTSVVSRS